jgi:DNA polymerase-3 subunit alpha
MKECGLNPEEIEILGEYLLPNNGICAEQEDLMSISMCEKISGFTMKEANLLRKAIAKKKANLIKQTKDLFYEKGTKLGTRKEMLDYVWNKQFSLSLGYSFARCHSVPYSCIGLQQLNLLYHYPMIYSQCASLLVASSSNEGNEENNIDYGKVATSVCQSKNSGVNFKPISINKAEKGFIPNAQENIIIAGLKGISGVNNEFADKIIANRPYDNIDDFIEKTQPLKTQMLSLIKAGAFDEFNPNRKEVMIYYINRIINQENTYKDKLTGANLDKIKSMNILPEEYLIYIRYYNFNKYITDKQFVYKKEGRKTLLIAKDIGFPFFEQHYVQDLVEDKDYYYCKDGIVFDKSAYNKIYKARLEKLTTYINTPEFLDKYNKEFLNQKFYEIWDKYCQGTEKDWEFDSYNYYVGEHALANVNMQKYNFSAFKDLPEKPIIEEEYEYKGRTCYRYNLSRICGVVLDNDRTKHTITLLTNKNEVVKVKYYAGQFIAYNTPVTEMVEGKKVTRDKSWLTRGNLLVLVGYRNDDMFIPRTYARSIYRHSTALIEDYDNLGNLTIRELRYGEKEKTWQDK